MFIVLRVCALRIAPRRLLFFPVKVPKENSVYLYMVRLSTVALNVHDGTLLVVPIPIFDTTRTRSSGPQLIEESAATLYDGTVPAEPAEPAEPHPQPLLVLQAAHPGLVVEEVMWAVAVVVVVRLPRCRVVLRATQLRQLLSRQPRDTQDRHEQIAGCAGAN